MIHLWMVPLLLAVPATVNPAPAFGRLEHRPEHYNIVVGGRSLACKRLQISANGSRGLRLRFIGVDQETGGSYQLSFFSLDGDQDSPLSYETQVAAWIHTAGVQPCSAHQGFALMASLKAFLQPAWTRSVAELMRAPLAARVTHATLAA